MTGVLRCARGACTGAILMLATSAPALGTDYVPNEIIVNFRPGQVIPPEGQTAGMSAAFSYTRTDAASILGNLGVTSMRKVVPWFTPDSVHVVGVMGDSVELPYDLSNLYVLELADTSVVSTATALEADSTLVAYAGPNWHAAATFAPTDSLFADQWALRNTGQFGGVVGFDAKVEAAWNITTGAGAPVRVGVIDSGCDIQHEDLVTVGYHLECNCPDIYDHTPNGHGTAVAGIIGARGNNRHGVAGVNWGAEIVPIKWSDALTGSHDNIVASLAWAAQHGLPIVNMSQATSNDEPFEMTATNAWTAGTLIVAAMGNDNGNIKVFPAGYETQTLAVGATFLDGLRWDTVHTSYPGCNVSGKGSNYGSWIDLVAPAGDMIASTKPGNTYYHITGNCTDGFGGTSAAAPMVSGVASLVKGYRPQLTNEDLAEVLKRTAADITYSGVGFDSATGAGMVNADSALKFVAEPNAIQHGVTGGAWADSNTGLLDFISLYSSCHDGRYWAERYKMLVNVMYPTPFAAPPTVWIRRLGTKGWSDRNPHTGLGDPSWAEVVPGSVTATGFQAYTYVYKLFNYFKPGEFVAWCPTEPWGDVHVAWTAVGPASKIPDVSLSYFVPQVGSVTSPTEGTAATRLFRACPNNDGVSSLPNNARIKVVVKDSAGNGIAGVAPADVYMLFNGGTPELKPTGQEYRGAGADSIIANSEYNFSPLCPDLRVVPADAPTDASGVTYVTFAGSSGTPGVASRDPNRKWGHFDTDIPVYVYWRRIAGRLTSGSSNGSYNLAIKGIDFVAGLGLLPNTGEEVNTSELNYLTNHSQGQPGPFNFSADLDGNGIVDMNADFNIWNFHQTHDCATPNNP